MNPPCGNDFANCPVLRSTLDTTCSSGRDGILSQKYGWATNKKFLERDSSDRSHETSPIDSYVFMLKPIENRKWNQSLPTPSVVLLILKLTSSRSSDNALFAMCSQISFSRPMINIALDDAGFHHLVVVIWKHTAKLFPNPNPNVRRRNCSKRNWHECRKNWN